MRVWRIERDGRHDISGDQLGADVADYVARARRQGLDDEEIEEDLLVALDRSPIPADDVRVQGDSVEVSLFS